MPGNKNKKITKYRRRSFFNIGTLLFSLVFIYMIIMVFMYLTQSHITSYEVKKGTLTGNYRYDAMALRDETVVTASHSGSVRYFEREGAKASAGGTVCAIDETGSLTVPSVDNFELSAEDADRLQDIISTFTINYTPTGFQRTYDLKSSVEGLITEVILDNSGMATTSRSAITAPESGFVLYSIDGYESLTEADLTASMFSQNTYSSENLRSQDKVNPGDPLFKLVTSEDWALCFPLDSKMVTELADMNSIKFRVLKDNVTFTSSFSIIENDSGTFGKISLDNSLVRYATERFLEIELVMNKKSGLKIPVSAISTRTFYVIPSDYVIANEDTEEEVVLITETFNDDGSSNVKYETATVYSHSGDDYLIDAEVLDEDAYLQMPNSGTRKLVADLDTSNLYGVYNINKGYAVFREITIIDENEEYCIVEPNNMYGLAAYDYIALDASSVTEDQIVY